MSNRKIILLFLSLFAIFHASAQLYESFEAGASLADSHWQGDLQRYKINKKGMLQSDGAGAERTSLYCEIPIDGADTAWCWEFYVKLSFNPSASNYALVLLMIDRPQWEEELFSGYYLQIGHKDDCLSFYRRDAGKSSLLAQGEAGTLNRSTNPLWIKVTRTRQGEWCIWSKYTPEESYVCEMRVQDETYRRGNGFGLMSCYTASRKTHFYYDDIRIAPWDGTDNEQGGDDGDGEDVDNPPLPPDPLPETIAYGEVVFNELMVNPKASPGLPEVEYVELYNASQRALSLQGCSFYYGEKGYPLPDSLLQPGQYILLLHPSKAEFYQDSLRTIPLTSFPTLRNTGQFLALIGASGEVIHWVDYTDGWYGDTKKKQGGYSLECIDPDNLGNLPDNWSASMSISGGTPGRENSLHCTLPDTVRPRLLSVGHYSQGCLELTFSKPMQADTLADLSHYHFLDSPLQVIDAYVVYPRHTSVRLKMNRFFSPQTDTLRLDPLPDKSGLNTYPLYLCCTQDTVEWFEEYPSDSEDDVLGDPPQAESQNSVWLEKDYFTPYASPPDERLHIKYAFPETGWQLRIAVYTLSGRLLDREESDLLPYQQGEVEWPSDQSAQTLVPGVYILHIECSHRATGQVRHFKHPFVVNTY